MGGMLLASVPSIFALVILCSLVILEFQIFKQGVVEFNILLVCEGKEIDQYYQQIIKCIQCSF